MTRWLRRHRATLAYLAVIAACGWAVNHASAQRSAQKLRELEAACRTVGNPGRALHQLEARDRVIARRWAPILDCHRTYVLNGGHPFALSDTAQDDYLRILTTGRLPLLLSNGDVR